MTLALGVVAGPPPEPLPITIVSMPSMAYPGGAATLIARTVPGSSCALSVSDASGRMQVLGSTTADIQGIVMWTWQVGTAPGRWPIRVTCAAGVRRGRLDAFLVVAPANAAGHGEAGPTSRARRTSA